MHYFSLVKTTSATFDPNVSLPINLFSSTFPANSITSQLKPSCAELAAAINTIKAGFFYSTNRCSGAKSA